MSGKRKRGVLVVEGCNECPFYAPDPEVQYARCNADRSRNMPFSEMPTQHPYDPPRWCPARTMEGARPRYIVVVLQ